MTEVIYLIDFSLPNFLPELHADLTRRYKIDLFPGGSNCIQQFVSAVGRPFMGPNLYVTPPGSSTWFHEDGRGTVDSGHQCLTGYNEVVMLPRLSEEKKVAALKILRVNHVISNSGDGRHKRKMKAMRGRHQDDEEDAKASFSVSRRAATQPFSTGGIC